MPNAIAWFIRSKYLRAYKAALGGQLKNRPGPARASVSLSPGFHPGSTHTRDVPINQYEISNQKSEIPFSTYTNSTPRIEHI